MYKFEWAPVSELAFAEYLKGGADAIRARNREYPAGVPQYDDHTETISEIFYLDITPEVQREVKAVGGRFAYTGRDLYMYIIIPLSALSEGRRLPFPVQPVGGGWSTFQTYSADDSLYLKSIR